MNKLIVREKEDKKKITRRQLLKMVAGTITAGPFLYLFLTMTEGEGYSFSLRPPGAAPREIFNTLCIRCGKCAKMCPYNAIKMADINYGIAVGTPYLIVRETPCYLCSDIPCISACPTSALDHSVKKREQINMGIAIITDREACLSLNGIRCEVCYRTCPLIDKAITLKTQPNLRTGRHTIFEPVIHKDRCVGCGQCEHNCVLEKPAIRVFPEEIISGEVGKHYIFGWK